MKIFMILAGAAAIALAGCTTPNISPQAHSSDTVGQVNRTVPATVVSARPVQVTGTNSVGRPVGAIAGGVAGSAIGGGTRANILGAIGGAVIGGLAGGAIEGSTTGQTGIEYVVELQSGGGLVTVVQGPEPVLAAGQRVLLIYGPPARLIADTRMQ